MKTFAAKTVLLSTLLGVSVAGALPGAAWAQSSSPVAPTLIPVSGRVVNPDGQPQTGTVDLTISLYDGQNDASPRWIEQQLSVPLDAGGGYSIQFGATLPEGLPGDLFTAGAGTRWLGVGVNGVEQPRVMLLSVPYAAKAASAETLGGKTASDFVLSSNFRDDLRSVLKEEGVAAAAGDDVGTNAIANALQKSNGASGLLDTNVYHVDGKIGIGTAGPVDPFQIRQGTDLNFFVSQNSGMVAMGTHNDAWSAWGDLMINGSLVFKANGNVGIGTQAPVDKLQIRAGTNLNFGVFTNSGMMAMGAHNDAWSSWGDLMLNGNAVFKANGNIGLGTLNPTSKLHVAGDVQVDGNIGAKYQDVAEWVDAAEPLEAGTVVIIDETAANRVRSSVKANDTRVAGAISPQPGIVLGEKGEGRVLVAQSGRVRIKADTRNGKIQPGDLLVTSPRAGYAMKAKSAKPGTVLGKALEPLDKGTGEILVLLTLQ